MQPNVRAALIDRPWGGAFAAGALCAHVASRVLLTRGAARGAFWASCAYIVGMVWSAAFGIYPYALPARDPSLGLTVEAAAAAPYGLHVALWWWLPGMALATGYTIFVYRRLPHGITPDDTQHH